MASVTETNVKLRARKGHGRENPRTSFSRARALSRSRGGTSDEEALRKSLSSRASHDLETLLPESSSSSTSSSSGPAPERGRWPCESTFWGARPISARRRARACALNAFLHNRARRYTRAIHTRTYRTHVHRRLRKVSSWRHLHLTAAE